MNVSVSAGNECNSWLHCQGYSWLIPPTDWVPVQPQLTKTTASADSDTASAAATATATTEC